MNICIPCRDGNPRVVWSGDIWVHDGCGERLTSSPRNWSPPKKNNKRAWKRIANGEWLWDRRRVRRSYRNRGPKSDTRIVFDTEIVEQVVGGWLTDKPVTVKVKRNIPGTEREVDNYRKKPVVDLGG